MQVCYKSLIIWRFRFIQDEFQHIIGDNDLCELWRRKVLVLSTCRMERSCCGRSRLSVVCKIIPRRVLSSKYNRFLNSTFSEKYFFYSRLNRFVFIMGSAIPFSLRSLKKKAVLKRKIFVKVIRRTCLLFLIGLSLNSQSG